VAFACSSYRLGAGNGRYFCPIGLRPNLRLYRGQVVEKSGASIKNWRPITDSYVFGCRESNHCLITGIRSLRGRRVERQSRRWPLFRRQSRHLYRGFTRVLSRVDPVSGYFELRPGRLHTSYGDNVLATGSEDKVRASFFQCYVASSEAPGRGSCGRRFKIPKQDDVHKPKGFRLEDSPAKCSGHSLPGDSL
jgi:hypothetical protein